MLKKWLVLLLTTTLFITACHSPLYNQTEANAADVKIKSMKALKKSDLDAKPAPSLVVNQGMYVDRTPISLYRDPSWLHEHVVIRGDQLPFSYYSRTVALGGGNYILTTYQPGLEPATTVTMNYTGTVKGALDLLASKTGYVYSVHGNSIFWQAFITRSFDIAFTPGSSDYLMGNTSGSGATSAAGGGSGGTVSNYVSSDSSTSEYSTFKGSLSVWDDLEKTIHQLLSKDGTVVVSQATTTVTVRDRPANVELVGQYVHNLNKNISKQVLVKVQVLEVELQNAYNFGLDWNLIIKAFHNSPFVINGNYGTPVSISPLTPQNSSFSGPLGGGSIPGNPPGTSPVFGTVGSGGIPSYTILFNALSQQGKTSMVTEPRAVCLNNQVSVIRITNAQNYIASVQTTSLATGGSTTNIGQVTSQVTPGTVVTGLTLYILPKIMHDRIYLQVNADISTLLSLQTLTQGGTGSTGVSIQVPEVAMKHFNQRSMIHSGDTLIMSGFRQVGNVANANQFLNSQALGGRGANQTNTETIILITPYILGDA